MFYGDFVSNFFSLDSILFALFDILTLFQGRLNTFKLFIGSMFQDNRTKFTKIFYFMNKKAPSFQKAL
ncbi:hypothetical protein LEP1GSC115_3126 [Leptospira interrogans serovar Australis str. 200703203]|uniref:Uncharacterized protein n=1 Tax=Leptospira interrogans serovar Australis str. 200703203 TaxID=1085541 RepID=N1UQN7_LEPIR|nr:hypothetical protein LEP1GSC115_3126 [Leptospira interrogans serovar Australis str. 200703203]